METVLGLLATLAVLGAFVLLFPLAALRLAARLVYRVRCHGRENIPAQGPALLVCNPVAYLDWYLLTLASPRPIHFFFFAGWIHQPLARFLIRKLRATASDGSGGPRELLSALRQVGAALDRGELVCIFAEGRKTDSGLALSFPRGLRQITKGRAVPILPVSLDQPWGSLDLPRPEGIRRKFLAWRHHLEVTFGKPLPAGQSAGEVRQALQRLSSDAAQARSDFFVPMHRVFIRQACRHPFRPCIYDSTSGRWLTYGKAGAAALALAGHLRPILGDAGMVATWLPPGAGGLLSNLALALLRKTSVNLNYTAPADSVRSALRQCQVRHVLTARRFTARMPLDLPEDIAPIYLDELLPKISSAARLKAFLKFLLLPGWLLDRLLGLPRHSIDDLATIIFSSGSTGEPKGVMLSHRNVAANVESMIQATTINGSDRALGVLPFFHSFGYTVTLWAPLSVGASTVYHTDPRQAKEIGELCRTQRCTIYLTTPTFLRFCLKKCGPDDFRSVRILMCGAEKLPPTLALDFQSRFGVLPLEGYGCTETAPAVAANMPDRRWGQCVQLSNKIGTIGPPLPGVSCRVIDPDTQQPLPLGREGVLVVRGPNVMRGYLNRPDLTAKVLLDGEYITGDMARIDEEGFITLTGRLSRFAKVGGEMVPLEKVEEELHELLGTAERVLAVAAVPDERKGERLVVLHLPLESADPHSLSRGLAERGLPNLWIPGERDFYLVDHLPLLGSGKLDLRGVKEMALAEACRACK